MDSIPKDLLFAADVLRTASQIAEDLISMGYDAEEITVFNVVTVACTALANDGGKKVSAIRADLDRFVSIVRQVASEFSFHGREEE